MVSRMKISVFVSSVQKELAEERRAVKEFITRDPLLSFSRDGEAETDRLPATL